MNGRKKAGAVVTTTVAALLLINTPVVQDIVNPDPHVNCDTSVIVAEDHAVHFHTLDEGKEVPLAFGTNANKGSIQGDLDEFCSRAVVDPSLVAGDMPSFGYIENNSAAIDAEELKMLNDPEYWKSVVDKMVTDINAASNFSTETVLAGSPSLYMKPNGDNSFINLYRGYTSHDGTIIKFTLESGLVVKLRLDCGFQPIFDVPPPGFPECTEAEGCAPPSSSCPEGTTGYYDTDIKKWVCKDSSENDVSQNPDVDQQLTDGDDHHGISNTDDGATNSIGRQDDPVGDAEDAEEEANADNAADESTHEEAAEDATVGSTDQEHTGGATGFGG